MSRLRYDAVVDASRIVLELSRHLLLGSLLEEVRRRWGAYELLEHWKQGEFHHDVVVRVSAATAEVGGDVLVVATNCNGGVKEMLWFDTVPDRLALWHARCPDNPEFEGEPVAPLSVVRTEHWFDPCELLVADARSEYRAEYRERQCGGGWLLRKPDD
ncbi:MAG TPA: hypothetical protein VH062_11820 [Polyangiaceae bacterium]|nr:hypothetical protein [Polyangiaceae bacterium]